MTEILAEPGVLTLYSGLALRDALQSDILPEFTKKTGVELRCRFDPTTVLVDQVHRGNLPDVFVGVTTAVDGLVDEGLFSSESQRSIASSAIGIAVPIGTVVPKFESAQRFVDFLLAARSVAYSSSGASGIYFAGLLERLGLTDRINARSTVLEKGFTAEAVVDGRADVAIQQLSELMAVPGVQVVDAVPSELQELTHFSAAVARGSSQSRLASDLVQSLTTRRSLDALRKSGLVVTD